MDRRFPPEKDAAPPTSLIGGYCLFEKPCLLLFQEDCKQNIYAKKYTDLSAPIWSIGG